MAVPQRRYPKEEFARRGDALYETKVRPLLTPADHGKYVAIDIETGEFEIADTELEAGDNLWKRLPDPQPWMVRIGYRAVHRFGGRSLRPR